jgi:FkbH-like protein
VTLKTILEVPVVTNAPVNGESPPLTLAQAMKMRQELQKGNGKQGSILCLANVRMDQVRVYLEAYLIGMDLPHHIIPENFGSLQSDLLAERSHVGEQVNSILLVVDSDFLGVGCSLRNFIFRSCSETDHKKTEESLKSIKAFLKNKKCSITILTIPVFEPFFASSPHGIESKIEREWIQATGSLRTMCSEHANVIFVPNQQSLSCDTSWFLASGEPLRGGTASRFSAVVAKTIYAAERRHAFASEPKKILLTDLDDTFWHGILGDDGADKLRFDESKEGLPHLLYQKFLRQLSDEGVLLAVVSKNNPELVEQAFKDLSLPCAEQRFAGISANWQPKSVNIKSLLNKLNLLAENAVFIDDNNFEIEQVHNEIAGITCLKFPQRIDDVPSFLVNIRQLFSRVDRPTGIEDRLRFYQSLPDSSDGLVPSLSGGDSGAYLEYLRSLKMELSFKTADERSYVRAFELINKTNQFNLNGDRITKSEFDLIGTNGAVITVSLKDRGNDFGIIGVILINVTSQAVVLRSCVLSCRVFSRGIERTMLGELRDRVGKLSEKSIQVMYNETPRNQPVKAVFGSRRESGQFDLRHSDLFGLEFPGIIHWGVNDL